MGIQIRRMKTTTVATVVASLLVLGVCAIVVGVPRWNEHDPDGTAQALGRLLTGGGVLLVAGVIAAGGWAFSRRERH
jgi:hypothetical protein